MSEKLILTIVSFNTMAALLPICMFILWKKPQYWHTTLAVFLGFLVGFVNLQSDEVILPVLLLLAFGFFLGFSKPHHGWIQAVVLGVWIPVGQAIHHLMQPASSPWTQDVLVSLVAFLPAALGVYSGIFLRKFSPERGEAGSATPAPQG